MGPERKGQGSGAGRFSVRDDKATVASLAISGSLATHNVVLAADGLAGLLIA